MSYAPPKDVEALPRAGLPFGLFSVVAFRESSDGHVFNGIQWRAMDCGPVSAVENPGCSTFGPGATEKDFSPALVPGEAESFLVYGTDKCGASARQLQEGEENATARLLAREEAQAEAAVWRRLAAVAEDLHPSGPLSPARALATLERWLGSQYGSLGAIHGDRGAVTLLDTLVAPQGSRLVSKVGTPVVAGAGYPGTGLIVDEVQRVTVTDTSDEVTSPSGTFTLTLMGRTTAPIAFDATAADVRDAVQALFLAEDGTTDIEVTATGGPLPGSVDLTFDGPYVGLPLTTANGSGLTNAGVAVTAVTEGGDPAPVADEAWLIASPALFGYRGPVLAASALDQGNNDHYAIAERQYVVGFDPCGVGAVRMDLTA
jgi:hypothetical protein